MLIIIFHEHIHIFVIIYIVSVDYRNPPKRVTVHKFMIKVAETVCNIIARDYAYGPVDSQTRR